MIDAKQISELRNRTGAGFADCKNALDETRGDIAAAIEALKKKGAIKAAKKSAERTASEGVIASYVHHNGKLASLLELACETDFVARNDEFKQLAADLALQVAAMDPQYVSPETIPAEEVEKKRQEFSEGLEGKPEDVRQKIVEGKLQKWYSEVCLMKQSFIKDEEKTVEDLVNALVGKIGEKIVPTRFTRLVMAPNPNQTC